MCGALSCANEDQLRFLELFDFDFDDPVSDTEHGIVFNPVVVAVRESSFDDSTEVIILQQLQHDHKPNLIFGPLRFLDSIGLVRLLVQPLDRAEKESSKVSVMNALWVKSCCANC